MSAPEAGRLYLSRMIEGAPFETVVERLKASLAAQGFGILTEIDVAAVMKAKLDKSMPPYRILGACQPGLAFQALAVVPQVGTMLPCNAIVRQDDKVVEVAIIDPVASLGRIEVPGLTKLAGEVREKLTASLAAI